MSTDHEIVMGLETHVRIRSKTKMFCSCRNAVELAEEPNIHVCPFCMGFPGALPVLNEEVVNLAVRAGLALRCTVNETSVFDRKSYFYPDSPSGYQITQLYHPIVEHGEVRTLLDGEERSFRIHRMHIETDAGKSVHTGSKTLLDYNRCCSPLMEIVTEPDFRSKEEVNAYLEELQKIMRWCGASDADMDKGQLRCDVNISIRKPGETILNNRVELKNLNSFAAIGRAIDNEFKRQIKIVESGGRVDQETRGWDDEKGMSSSQRSKEDAMDYRYFPEPDLPPLIIEAHYIQARDTAELPIDRRLRYLNEYKLQPDDARILSNDRILSDYYEELVKSTNDPKKSCSYITSILFPLWDNGLCNLYVTTEKVASPFSDGAKRVAIVINHVNNGALSSTGAKALLEHMSEYKDGANDCYLTVDQLIDSMWLRQVNDAGTLEAIVQKVIENNPSQVAEYKAGKVNLFGFFVGQCMKESAGQGNPKIFTELMKKILS